MGSNTNINKNNKTNNELIKLAEKFVKYNKNICILKEQKIINFTDYNDNISKMNKLFDGLNDKNKETLADYIMQMQINNAMSFTI